MFRFPFSSDFCLLFRCIHSIRHSKQNQIFPDRPMGSHPKKFCTSRQQILWRQNTRPAYHIFRLASEYLNSSVPRLRLRIVSTAVVWQAYLLHLVAHFPKKSTGTNPTTTTFQTPFPPSTYHKLPSHHGYPQENSPHDHAPWCHDHGSSPRFRRQRIHVKPP